MVRAQKPGQDEQWRGYAHIGRLGNRPEQTTYTS